MFFVLQKQAPSSASTSPMSFAPPTAAPPQASELLVDSDSTQRDPEVLFESLQGFPGFRSLPGYPATLPQQLSTAPPPATSDTSPPLPSNSPRSIGEEVVRRRP